MNKTLLFILATGLCAQNASSQLIINEVMQSNVECIMDDINEFPDSWVELYNAGDKTEKLSDYALGVKDKRSKAYQLPNRSISPQQHIIIYCDKEETGLHTSFRLESGKDGAVYLFKGNDIADCITGMKKMPAPDIAYGRISDGAQEWGYQRTPTPGKANCGTVIKDILGEPVFSHPGRVGNESFKLTVTPPDDAPEGTVVRYTTDGKEPTSSSPEFKDGINIYRTTVVRARLFCDGYLSPKSTAQSYIFFPREMTLPVVSMVCPREYFFDNKTGIYVSGSYSNGTPNYEYDWRRPVNLEIFFEQGGEAVINQLCETRVKGGASRGNSLKSLVLYANKRFGTKRFEYEFFPEDAPGLTDWKSIELRNAGNDFDYLYFRDALIQRIMGRHADLDWQPYQPAIFMLNGEYKGMLNIRTRSNEDHIYTFYNGLEDIDMVENGWELKEGTIDSFNAFKNFYADRNHTLAEYEQIMDVKEYANLMIMNLFFDNKDFPGNNIVCWRPQAEDGKWRWVAKDTDFGIGLYNAPATFKTFNWIYDPNYDPDHAWANQYEHTRLFRRLMDIPDFRQMFVDMCAVYIGDFLNTETTVAELDRMYDQIKDEYPHHRKLFNEWWPNYASELQWAKNWITIRTPFFINHLAEYFNLGTPRVVKIDPDRDDDVKLTVNGVELCGRSFDGKYFEGMELKVTGADSFGNPVSQWNVSVTKDSQTTTETYDNTLLSFKVPAGVENIVISSVEPSNSVEGIENDNTDRIDPFMPVQVVDLRGVRLGTYSTLKDAETELAPGIYIVRQNIATAKIVIK